MIFLYIVLVIAAIMVFILLSWIILSPIISALNRIANVLEQFDVSISEGVEDVR